MSFNLAVDIGGTFTDLIGYDDATGQVYHAKSPSTPSDLALGIFNCLQKGGISVSDAVNFIHGSTVAINTVIERKGASTALVTTRGTRDVYEIGRGNRPDAYNIFFKRPTPLVPRRLRFEVDERLAASGKILTTFNVLQAGAVADEIARIGIDAVAVCFLHSWANPDHEVEMGKLLAAVVPDAYLSLSHQILREYGEYERTSTTVLNSYIGPRVSKYLDDLEKLLTDHNFAGSLLIMQSNGGVMSPAAAKRLPVAMLESGPVGGFIAAARTGKALGFGNVIALDMGGTTAKTSLIKDGEPQLAQGYYIGGYASGHPMMLPVIDTIEIGAGGGSIAWIDKVGALKVGPGSAGAEPGPICYMRGGVEPTITDANLLLGRLSPDSFLGGEMPLDVDGARQGIGKIASRLGLSEIETALAIIKIAVMKMSLAVRGVSVERGYDPRDFALVAFGGAGALHAVEVARELHIPTVVVPNFPGQFSALGMLMADIQHDYVRTYCEDLNQADFRQVKVICDELMQLGRQTLVSEAVPAEAMLFQRFLDLRYSGQEFAIPVPMPDTFIEQADRGAIGRAFNEHHDRKYGYHAADQQVEIVNIRLSAIGKRKQLALPALKYERKEVPLTGKRMVYLSGKNAAECPVYSRPHLAPGYKITGPAIIQEYACTTVLLDGDMARVAETGPLIINIGEGCNGC